MEKSREVCLAQRAARGHLGPLLNASKMKHVPASRRGPVPQLLGASRAPHLRRCSSSARALARQARDQPGAVGDINGERADDAVRAASRRVAGCRGPRSRRARPSRALGLHACPARHCRVLERLLLAEVPETALRREISPSMRRALPQAQQRRHTALSAASKTSSEGGLGLVAASRDGGLGRSSASVVGVRGHVSGGRVAAATPARRAAGPPRERAVAVRGVVLKQDHRVQRGQRTLPARAADLPAGGFLGVTGRLAH